MPGIKDRQVQVTEIVQANDGLVTQKETLREASDDESQSTEVTVNRFVSHWCGHYKPFGFSCHCGKRFCRDCESRAMFCEECGATLGPCCYRKRYDGKVLCPEHWKVIDWGHPGFRILGGAAFLGALILALYVLERIVR